MRILVGVQARSDSKRFPGKIYEKIGEYSMLEHVYRAAVKAKEEYTESELVPSVLIPVGDETAAAFCRRKGFDLFEGFKDDLFLRYGVAARRKYFCNAIIRVTGDCPLIPWTIIVDCARALEKVDYSSNTVVRTYPEGWDVQGARIKAFDWLDKNQNHEREHPFCQFDANKTVRDRFEKEGFTWSAIIDRGSPILMKLSVDTKEDLQFVQNIITKSGKTDLSKS